MKLKGERIVIRDIKYSDSYDFYEYGKDPLVGPMAGWKPFPSKEVSDRILTANIINKEMFAITIDDKLIGTISLYKANIRKNINCRELGFCLNKCYRNLGYMTEAVEVMLDYGFNELSLDLIMVCHHEKNIASQKVIRKFPFKYEGTLRMYRKLCDGTIVDGVMYSMKKEEFLGGINDERD